jgi:hypothetical protein
LKKNAWQREKYTAVATAAFQPDTSAVPMLLTGAAHRSYIAVPTRMGRRHAVQRIPILVLL